jgi:hypothetical protein
MAISGQVAIHLVRHPQLREFVPHNGFVLFGGSRFTEGDLSLSAIVALMLTIQRDYNSFLRVLTTAQDDGFVG